MKSESPSPAAHLVRYGVASARGAFRAFLRHAWMQTDIAQENSAVFDEALAGSETLLPLGAHPWASVLARALQRVARLFADESMAQRFAVSGAGAELAPAISAFAALCADMDIELETSGFEVRLGESEASARDRLAPFLPEKPVVAHLGAARVWLPELLVVT